MISFILWNLNEKKNVSIFCASMLAENGHNKAERLFKTRQNSNAFSCSDFEWSRFEFFSAAETKQIVDKVTPPTFLVRESLLNFALASALVSL